MSIIKRLRPLVERFPNAAACYRLVRDDWRFRHARPVEMPQGFFLAGDRKIESGRYETAESELVAGLLGAVSVFVDVGANVGFYTCLARRAGVEVLAVEPLERNLRFLYRNLQANGFDDVEVFPLGLDERPGLTSLYGTSATASTLSGWSSASTVYSRTIPTTSLDLLLGGRFLTRPLLIKIDVEGAERAVLAGARETLARPVPPIWMVEIYLGERHPEGKNPAFREIFELFWEHGYVARRAAADAAVVERAEVEAWWTGSASPPASPNYLFRQEPGDEAPG